MCGKMSAENYTYGLKRRFTMNIYPIKMNPVFKDYIWGGTLLKTKYGKKSPYDITAESWEIAVHKDGASFAINGEYAGKNISEIEKDMGELLIGSLNRNKKFPLMLKLIDAKDNLSVQVHPDDKYAALHENGELGKTEMWHIIDCEKNAKLVFGFNRDIDKEEFLSAIKENKLETILNYVDVKKGDTFFIKAGTVHAIGSGILIAEIQQNSNTTYRVYDWGRVGKDGKPRELHVEKAIDVSDLTAKKGCEKVSAIEVDEIGAIRKYLCSCEYFGAEKVEVKTKACETANGKSFQIILVVSGNGKIIYNKGEIEISAGNSILIPAALGKYEIVGKMNYMKYYTPDFSEDFIRPLTKAGFTENEIFSLKG